MRMLCICAKGDPTGYLTIAGQPLTPIDIGKAAAIDTTEAEILTAELSRWGVFSRDRKGRIYCRRMVRDVKRSEIGRKHVKKRWSQASDNACKNRAPNRVPIRGPTTPEARSQKLERKNSGSPDGEPMSARPGETDLLGEQISNSPDVVAAFSDYCATAKIVGLPVPILTAKRRKAIGARLREHGSGAWATALEKIRSSPFLRGETGRDSWRGADLDWLIRPNNFPKVVEGKYNGNKHLHNGTVRPSGKLEAGRIASAIAEDIDRRRAERLVGDVREPGGGAAGAGSGDAVDTPREFASLGRRS